MSSSEQSLPHGYQTVEAEPASQGAPASEQHEPTHSWPWVEGSPSKLAQALLFGVIFGFLLQKGGVAKFDILIGALLLENFVVMQVMLTAIVTGMIGVYFLQRAGLVELKIKETDYGANIVGGLIFGVGFALLAYCPGTNAAALGQGNWDALLGVVGMMAGSYLFAAASNSKYGTVSWGKRGKITLPEIAGVSKGAFIAIAAPVLVGILVLLELFTS